MSAGSRKFNNVRFIVDIASYDNRISVCRIFCSAFTIFYLPTKSGVKNRVKKGYEQFKHKDNFPTRRQLAIAQVPIRSLSESHNGNFVLTI